MHAKFALGTVTLALLLGATGSAHGRHQVQVRIDKGAEVGASRNPRQHGYEHACRDGADRGRFDRAHGFRYNRNATVYNDSARGYERVMGNKGEYQQGYREGYRAGYDSAYRGTPDRDGRIDRRPDEPRNQWQRTTDPYATCEWGVTDTASDIGDRDGVPSDQNDRGRNLRVLISTIPTPGGIPDSQSR